MDRIFKPSWFRAAKDAPLSVGKENRVKTRLLRLPKAGVNLEGEDLVSGNPFHENDATKAMAAVVESD